MANVFDQFDAPAGNPFDKFDAPAEPNAGKTPAQPPMMTLSEPDASGRRYAIPTTDYNKPEQPTGIGTRMWEGMKAPYEEPLGFSQENLQKYPTLGWLQEHLPHITLGDAVLRAPSAVIGGLTGAAAGLAEPLLGRSWADRLQRDLNLGAQAAAPEVPMEAGALPLRQGLRAAQLDRTPLRRPVEPPPIPAEPPPLVPRQVPRPQAGVDLLPADTPHTLPPERRSLGAAGAGGPLANTSPETIQYMRQVMEEQGFTPHTIDQRLGELSEHHMFGEITPSLEADMGAIAAPPGPGKLEVMNSLRQRAVEARERVQHVFDRAFGVNENLAQLKRTMVIDRQRAADPFYERFKQTVITPSPAIEALMPRLQASGALQAANRKLAVAGEPAARGFPIPGEPPTMQYVPTASAFQYAKEALDDRITRAVREGEAGDARLYVGLQHDLLDALDTHPQVGDVWRQARSTYAAPTEIMKAADFGQQVLTSKIHPDELPFLTAGYSAPQMAAMRLGMRNHLENVLGKRDALMAEAINTALSPNNIQKMRWAIGDEATEQLVNAMEAERHMHTAPTRVHGGSPTALRLEAQKRWTVQPAGPGMTLQDMAHAAHKPVRTALKKGVEKVAEHIGASKRRELEARMARMREEAARIFTLQGPERDAVARYLVNPEEPLPARKEGGRVNDFHRARHAYTIKKQGGGELDPGESWQPGQEEQPAPAPAPPIAEPPPAETPQINQPFGELKPYYPRPTERFTHGLQDVLSAAGANPYSARHMAEGLTGVAGMVPPVGVGMSVADLISATQRHDIGAAIPAAIGAIPMAGRARGAAKAAEEAMAKRVFASPEYNPAELHEAAISTRLPTGAKATEDPIAQSLTVDTPSMKATPGGLYDQNVGLVRDYPGMKKGLMTGSTDRAAKQFQNQVTDNLLWLHDQVPPEVRERSKLWYDGANKIVKDTAQRYGLPDQSVAGVYAALSPQKDWFQNVSLGDRLIDIYHNAAATPWSPEMSATAKTIFGDPKYKKMLDAVSGKRLDQLSDPADKAMWIRTFDQAHNSPAHRIVTPEGGFGDVVTTKSGAPARVAWGSLTEIGKGVGAIESGGNPSTLSQLMGEKHKVRSFYNNMLDPRSRRGDVTIDTHAVAAGLLRPLSGNSLEVAHNFQNYPGKGLPSASGSAISGIQGTYPLYADAYRQAAAERGILPREMQSITWEAVRGLFPDTFKTAKNNEAIDNIWKQYSRGRLDLNEARSKIHDLAGGIRNPDWYGR